MSHQDGLGNNGAEATGLSKPDDGDDRMQKKSENVAHGRNGIKLNKLENSGHLQFAYDTILGPFGGRFSGVHRRLCLNADVSRITSHAAFSRHAGITLLCDKNLALQAALLVI